MSRWHGRNPEPSMTGLARHTCCETTMGHGCLWAARSNAIILHFNWNLSLYNLILLDSFGCVGSIQSAAIPHCTELTFQAPEKVATGVHHVTVPGYKSLRSQCHWLVLYNILVVVKCIIDSDCLRREVVEIATVQLDRAFFILKKEWRNRGILYSTQPTLTAGHNAGYSSSLLLLTLFYPVLQYRIILR